MGNEYENEYEKERRQDNYRREEVYKQLIPEQRKKIDKSKSFIIKFRIISSLLCTLLSFILGWIIGNGIEYVFLGLIFGFIFMIICIIIAPFLPQGRIYRFFCKWCNNPNAQWSDLRKVLMDK